MITGVGAVSPLGVGVDPLWSALMEGRSGIRVLQSQDMSRFPVQIGGEIPDFEPKLYVKPRKALKVMCREIQTAFTSATMAMSQAGLEKGDFEPDRLGVVYGSELTYGEVSDFEDLYRSCISSGTFEFGPFGDRFPSDMFPLWMLKYLPNMAACHIGIAYDGRAHNNSIVLGEVSSLLAIVEASRVIRRGHADIMLAGGCGNRISLTGWMYRGDVFQSHRNDAPDQACRPFDADRDGLVNSEGAGTIVLESREHATSRGATILATLCASASTVSTNVNDSEANAGAVSRSIEQALSSAKVTGDSIDHINAHGISTEQEDAQEAQGIHSVLPAVPVTAPKSFFGNLGAATGVVELITSLISLQSGKVPITLNYERPDKRCPIKVISGDPKEVEKPNVVSLSQARTGQAVAVVVSDE